MRAKGEPSRSKSNNSAGFDRLAMRALVTKHLSIGRLGGVYVVIGLAITFTLWVPNTFPKTDTIAQILNGNAILALISLSLVTPLAAGFFDISGPYTMALTGIMTTSLIVYDGYSVPVAVILVLLGSSLIGAFNAATIIVFKIDSLIATLATGFLLTAIVLWRTGNKPVTSPKLIGEFQQISRYKPVWQITAPVFYALIIAGLLWYVFHRRPTGPSIYATGFSAEAARLAGIRTGAIRFGAAITSSVIAGFAGIVLASNLGAGAPGSGLPYLLPAFAAVFLGATQVHPGRINVVGTLVAILILGTLNTGLGLAEVSRWVQQFTAGVVLLGALAISGYEARQTGGKGKKTFDSSKPGEPEEDRPTSHPQGGGRGI